MFPGYFARRTALTNQVGYQTQVRGGMRKKLVVPLAQIVEPRLAVVCLDEPMFRAAAPTPLQHLALAALFGQGRQFVLTKTYLF